MSLHRLARRQHGVVTRAQALEAGRSAKQIRWQLETGRWLRLHRGVYLTNSGRPTWHARAWAALLWSGPGAVLILEAAAHLWRLEAEPPQVIAVGVPFGRHPKPVTGVRPVQRRRLESVTVDGFPVTRAAQTVIDLADQPRARLDDAVALAARACQRNLVSQTRLLDELLVRRRHRFSGELRLALGEIGSGAESLPEVWFARRVLRRHRLPGFEAQVVEPGGTRTDLKNRRFGVNVEVDGQLWHAGDRFHRDRRNDRRAAARGEVTLRVTYLELDRTPCAIAAEVAAVLRRRGWSGTPLPCSPACQVARQRDGLWP